MLLNAFYGSCLTLNDLAICTENTLCVFKICPFTWLFQDMRLTNKYCSYACGASKFQMYFFIFLVPKTCLTIPLVLNVVLIFPTLLVGS